MKGSMKKFYAVILALVLTVTGLGLDLFVGNKGVDEVQAATTDTYKKIGFTDYGICERTEYINSAYDTPLGTQSTEALTNVEFEGIINIPENQQVAFWFGGTKRTNGVSLQFLPGGGANFGWVSDGRDDVKQYVNRADVAGSYQTAYPLQGHDIILNVKLTPKAVSDTTSDVDVTVTMTKRETMETFYSLSFTKTGVTTSVLAPNLYIWPVSGKMTLEPMDWEWKQIGFTDYGIYERKEFTNSSFETPLGTQHTEALTNVEFEGIINIPENQQVAFWFGGTRRTNGVSLQFLPDGGANFGWVADGRDDVKQYVNRADVTGSYQTAYPLQGHDIILNVKLTPKAVSDTTSDVDVTVTMTKRETMETFYSLSFTKTGVTTSVLAPNLFIWPVNGKMTLEPMDWEWKQMGFADYGYSERTQYSNTSLTTFLGAKSEEALPKVEFKGIINLPTNQRARIWFGVTKREYGHSLYIEKDGTAQVGWCNGGTDYWKQYMNQPSKTNNVNTTALQGRDIIVTIKLAPQKVDDTTSKVYVATTLTDRITMETIYTFSYEQTNVPTTVLAPNILAWTVDAGSYITIDPRDTGYEWTVLDMKDFGIPTGTSASPQLKDLDGTMDMVKIEATLNIPDTISGEVGPHIGGIIGFQNNGEGEALWIRTLGGSNTGFGNLASIGYTYNADVDWELYFWYEDGTDDSEDTVYLRMALYLDGKYIGTYKTGKEERAIDILRRVQIPAQVTVVYDGAALTVGGEGTHTDAIDVMVEQGDALPTGYIADGKYILGWTADGTAVTDYDKAKSNYVAKFVDTKMLTVKQQNNGQSPKDVRFIGSLDTLNGYDEAGFVFANRKVNGQLTIDNGARVQLNTAYVALNAAGQSVTPAQTYDSYSNYFFAYALKEIPIGQTIYARAYVRIGDTIIYGATSEFVIDTLN